MCIYVCVCRLSFVVCDVSLLNTMCVLTSRHSLLLEQRLIETIERQNTNADDLMEKQDEMITE
jgi:hypothetical protein